MLPSVRHAVRCVWAHPMQIQRVVIARWFRAPRRGAVAWPPNLSVVFGLMLACEFSHPPAALAQTCPQGTGSADNTITCSTGVTTQALGRQIERCHPRRR